MTPDREKALYWLLFSLFTLAAYVGAYLFLSYLTSCKL